MELHFSDANDLRPEIPVNISCQRMETLIQEKGTAAPSIKDDCLKFNFFLNR
jgi:hypothetical protein